MKINGLIIKGKPDFEPNFGTWAVSKHPKLDQECAVLNPSAPVYRQFRDWLDTQKDGESTNPIDVKHEAVALTLFCLQHGSYFDSFWRGRRYQPFIEDEDQTFSRISDYEMKRVNIETSAALSYMLDLKANDPSDYERLLRKVLFHCAWSNALQRYEYESIGNNLINTLKENFPITSPEFKEWSHDYGVSSTRAEANAMINFAYRNNSGIEEYHAGHYSMGRDVPGFRRIYQDETPHISRNTARNLAFCLYIREMTGRGDFYYQAFLKTFKPFGWSTTEETSEVFFDGWPDVDIRQYLPAH